MGDKKNIDRLFQEKFKDHEVFPEPIVWKNIEKQLTKKKKRRIVPLWLRFAGAAAILLLFVTIGYRLYNVNNMPNKESQKNIITNTEDKNSNEIKSQPESEQIIITNTSTADQLEQNTKNKPNNVASKNRISVKSKFNTNRLKSDNSESNQIAINNDKEITTLKGESNRIIIDTTTENIIVKTEASAELDGKRDIFDAIDEDENITENNNKTEEKWAIGSTIAPVYYNTLSNGSPIDASLANNSKNSISSISYGLKVNYKITDKLSLRSGINRVDLGYSTKDVTTLLSSSLLNDSKSNINSNIEGVEIATISTATQGDETIGARASFDQGGELDQTFSYVEVPFEAKYNVLQKKLGVNVVGGFSTYMLYQNKVTHTSFGKKTTLGEASNLNTVNFSGNLGLDFDYNISKKLFINVSPMFKYQFNTFSKSSGGFQPYYFGVYTGVNFRF